MIDDAGHCCSPNQRPKVTVFALNMTRVPNGEPRFLPEIFCFGAVSHNSGDEPHEARSMAIDEIFQAELRVGVRIIFPYADSL
jgi:hypothetical protein